MTKCHVKVTCQCQINKCYKLLLILLEANLSSWAHCIMGYNICSVHVTFNNVYWAYKQNTVFPLLHALSICCFHLGQVESGGSLCEPCVWYSPVTPAAGHYWQDKWAGTRVWNSVLPCANQGLTGNHPSKTCHSTQMPFSYIWNNWLKWLHPPERYKIKLKSQSKWLHSHPLNQT